IASIYETGRGSIKVRSKWRYLKSENLIEIYEIPYSTTAEAIIDKVAELQKAGKVKEISDMRDETDLSGLKLAIDLKRGADPEKLMQRLFRMTPLMDSFSCNFNVLVAGMPRVMGIREILSEWCAWRMECVKRRVFNDLSKKKDKLHLLLGLEQILLDIDRAIEIIRNTEEESEVVPNLMIGFGIDEIQAEYVAEIKLRNINREYILKRTQETSSLKDEIADLEDLLNSKRRIKNVIISELKVIIKKYGQPRKTDIVYDDEIEEVEEEIQVEDYAVHLFLSKEGYFKKITPLSLRMGGEQKFKENDSLLITFETSNRNELLVFTDKCQVYKTRVSDFDDTKASALGSYLPSVLGMDDGETPVFMMLPGNYSGQLIFFFENGKAAKVELSAYATKTNRKKLTGAYSDKSPLRSIVPINGDIDLAVYSTDGRLLIFNSSLIAAKATRNSQGVAVMSLKKKYTLDKAMLLKDATVKNFSRYKVKTVPAAGAILKPEDMEEKQMDLFDI
ncbi:MAG: topoisomerase IV, partial [Oscillospiraceae bacterium]|nr:topoisomerase IV [Oscillospiraceae bacterium]